MPHMMDFSRDILYVAEAFIVLRVIFRNRGRSNLITPRPAARAAAAPGSSEVRRCSDSPLCFTVSLSSRALLQCTICVLHLRVRQEITGHCEWTMAIKWDTKSYHIDVTPPGIEPGISEVPGALP
jgi:hypothetical protein